MRVVVVGAYGLLGGYVVSGLHAAGHDVVGVGRRIQSAMRRFPYATWVEADLATTTLVEWERHFVGVDAVVNCAGALQDGPDDSLQRVHVDGLSAMAAAARAAGVQRFIHVSAVGVTSASPAFGRSKFDGEQALSQEDIAWTILRPGLILAPAAFGGSALLRGLAVIPFAIPAICPESPIMVVAAEDVGRAVIAAIQPTAPRRVIIDLVAAPTYRLRDVLTLLRAWLGLPSAPVIALPVTMARLTAWIADGLAWLGWRSPMRSTAVAQLRQGVVGDPASAQIIGVHLQTLEEMLASRPSGVQDRWFAKSYFCKPLALGTLAWFWTLSGLIGLCRIPAAKAVLVAGGFAPGPGTTAVVVGALVDLLLGLAVCHKRSARLALQAMVIVPLAYLVGATLWRPDLWSDPLGPLVKVVPAAVLACLALAIMDER